MEMANEMHQTFLEMDMRETRISMKMGLETLEEEPLSHPQS